MGSLVGNLFQLTRLLNRSGVNTGYAMVRSLVQLCASSRDDAAFAAYSSAVLGAADALLAKGESFCNQCRLK
jgi:hypothetical protein